MKWIVPIALGVLLLGCKKHEVDIAALNTNPFDNDHSGAQFIRVDSVRTFPLGQGVVFQQRLYIGLAPELIVESDFELRLIELTTPDTTIYTNIADGATAVVMLNQQVTLGTEYCYLIDLRVGSAFLTTNQLNHCAVAQL